MTNLEEGISFNYRNRLLEEADGALQAACNLLDRLFQSRGWREDWTIADTATKLRQEMRGFDSFEEAEAEAAKRTGEDGVAWGAFFDAHGAPVVRLFDY